MIFGHVIVKSIHTPYACIYNELHIVIANLESHGSAKQFLENLFLDIPTRLL